MFGSNTTFATTESPRRRAIGAGLALAAVLSVGATGAVSDANAAGRGVDVFVSNGRGGTVPAEPGRMVSAAEARGSIPVIVRMRTDFAPEGDLSLFSAANQRAAIASARRGVLSRVTGEQNIKEFETVPMVAMTLDARGVNALLNDRNVLSITEDVAVPPLLDESVPIIRANKIWKSKGKTGKGWTVAVLDTGYATKHPAFKNKVKSQACYSTTNSDSRSLCPGGVQASTKKGSARNCNLRINGCYHGTHVAGIAVGNPRTKYKGVARRALLLPIQVFSKFSGSNCGSSSSPCPLSYTSDQMRGLERVYKLRRKFRIASVNMSLGGGGYSRACDDNALKPIIDNLRKAKIATVIASGNSYLNGMVAAPGCISSAITVGSTDKSDNVSAFSNHSKLVDMMAPGQFITAPLPPKSYGSLSGTSMAAPHVAGAWALMREAFKKASVTSIERAFKCTGKKVERAGIKKRRIDVFNAFIAMKRGC